MASVFVYAIYTFYGFCGTIGLEHFNVFEIWHSFIIFIALTFIVIYYSSLLTNEVRKRTKFTSSTRTKIFLFNSFTLIDSFAVKKNSSNCTRYNPSLPQFRSNPIGK